MIHHGLHVPRDAPGTLVVPNRQASWLASLTCLEGPASMLNLKMSSLEDCCSPRLLYLQSVLRADSSAILPFFAERPSCFSIASAILLRVAALFNERYSQGLRLFARLVKIAFLYRQIVELQLEVARRSSDTIYFYETRPFFSGFIKASDFSSASRLMRIPDVVSISTLAVASVMYVKRPWEIFVRNIGWSV